ncbi:rhamnogalacturonan lyase [Paenibacillus sp. 32352]|uniref:rhamnogalacturonan lyase n=1 Tax=Paenibacillus sp. 32352 TaxID=1969111 RepID=UPI0009ADC8C5|nr:rhamnogalacturonan lyase [Paenibacillus sp. 32352]
MNKKLNRRFKKTSHVLAGAILLGALAAPLQASAAAGSAGIPGASSIQRQMEYLDRGLVAVKTDSGVFVSWRLLGNEPDGIAFNLYRDGVKVNSSPITNSTNYQDNSGSSESKYTVRAVLNGKEQPASAQAGVWDTNYLSVPLQKPADGVNPDGSTFTYSANDASVGDLDGDGQYEIVLKWDPSNSKDNSQDGVTGEVFIDAYKLDGTLLWRIGLGKNIRAGAHYTQFMVYDLDGDGKAEIAFKTADGTTDGTGKVIGDANADYRDLTGSRPGRVLSGPEYLSIFEGKTGKELVTVPYDPPRGKVTDWGDNYGNRVDRFLACIAYLDGKRPSLVMARGYYTRTVLAAYNWRDGQLTKLWTFDSNEPGNETYAGQGNHNLSVADVDGDGKDEIIYGAVTIDDNGKGLYNTRLGHGDALHVGDLDPGRPGLEVFKVNEDKNSPYGAAMWDAATGEVLWGVHTGKDTGRGMSADIDPNYEGEEVWASTGVGLYSNKGQKISSSTPSINFGIWWDGDLLRELLDNNHIDKWDYNNYKTVNLLTATEAASNNGTKANPALQADLFGDWREEAVWRTEDSTALHIYTTTDLTDHRIYTLMHDPVYRLGIAWQNVAYNQPPHTGFYLGVGMETPPAPNMYVVLPAEVKVEPQTLNLKSQGGQNSVTVSVQLPAGYDASAIDASTVQMSVYGSKPIAAQAAAGNKAALKFDRQQLIGALQGQNGNVEVTITGALRNGHTFRGTDIIKVNH